MNILLLSGIINFLLVITQVLGGLRVLKISFKWHKFFGIILLVTASIHGLIAILANI